MKKRRNRHQNEYLRNNTSFLYDFSDITAKFLLRLQPLSTVVQVTQCLLQPQRKPSIKAKQTHSSRDNKLPSIARTYRIHHSISHSLGLKTVSVEPRRAGQLFYLWGVRQTINHFTLFCLGKPCWQKRKRERERNSRCRRCIIPIPQLMGQSLMK